MTFFPEYNFYSEEICLKPMYLLFLGTTYYVGLPIWLNLFIMDWYQALETDFVSGTFNSWNTFQHYYIGILICCLATKITKINKFRFIKLSCKETDKYIVSKDQ